MPPFNVRIGDRLSAAGSRCTSRGCQCRPSSASGPPTSSAFRGLVVRGMCLPMTNQHLDGHMQFAPDHEWGEFGIHVLPHDLPLPFFEQQIRLWDGANPGMDTLPVFVEAFMLPTRDSRVRRTFVKPAPLNRFWTFSSSARANDVRTTLRISDRQRAIASARKPQIGARSGYEITHTDALPPGRSTRRNSERPCAGSGKNCRPS
jgi:hypothetical protein